MVLRSPLRFLGGHMGIRAELLELSSPCVPSSVGQRGSEGMAAGRGSHSTHHLCWPGLAGDSHDSAWVAFRLVERHAGRSIQISRGGTG